MEALSSFAGHVGKLSQGWYDGRVMLVWGEVRRGRLVT